MKIITLEKFKKILKASSMPDVQLVVVNGDVWTFGTEDEFSVGQFLFIERHGYGMVFYEKDNQEIRCLTEGTETGRFTTFFVKSRYDGLVKMIILTPSYIN